MKKTKSWIILLAVTALLAITCTVVLSAAAEELPDAPVVETVDTESPNAQTAEVGIVSDAELDVTVSDHIYKQEKLLLVTVGNLNESVNYSINVNVTYYGIDGEILGTETQSFDQLASGFSWNFIFQPGYDFVDYRLETEKTVFEGECWKTCVTDVHVINEGYLQVKFYNNRDLETIATKFKMVIFDEYGEVFDVNHKSAMLFAECNSYRANGVGGEDCEYLGCDGGHPIDHDEYELCGYGRLNAFVTHEVILPETHPDYQEWLQYADLPGNVLGND